MPATPILIEPPVRELSHDELRAAIREGLKPFPGVKLSRAILFGSRAKGTAHAYSDYDILLVSARPLNRALQSEVRQAVSFAIHAYDVPADVILVNAIRLPLLVNPISVEGAAVEEGIDLLDYGHHS
jgi:predicted nucleotidyltransferase